MTSSTLMRVPVITGLPVSTSGWAKSRVRQSIMNPSLTTERRHVLSCVGQRSDGNRQQAGVAAGRRVYQELYPLSV